MKVFENKSLFKKIVIIMLFITISGFCFSGDVQAANGVATGGKLLEPISDFLVFLGDSFMNIIHKFIYGYWSTTIHVDLIRDIAEIIFGIVIGVVVAIILAKTILWSWPILVEKLALIGFAIKTVTLGTAVTVGIAGGGLAAISVINSEFLSDTVDLPVYQISPDMIFSNKILFLDVDFFNPRDKVVATNTKGEALKDENGNVLYWESTANQLQSTLSKWYNTLRDIAVVVLLSVLVYIGIRIVLSSTANDKSKYKQMLLDWVVAMCLLFFMQYIMSFSNMIVNNLTNVLTNIEVKNVTEILIPDKNGKVSKTLEKMEYDLSKIKISNDDGDFIRWTTNTMGVIRINAQLAKQQNTSYAAYGVMFFVLVLFTMYFLFTYLKRVLYMAFLTMIAPLVAMTYPIDKMNDGKAQAFNMWFKEYIFNLLIQPMHLILYTVLVSSAFELASTNYIYTLTAIGFMIPAEKLLRKFFGFEKAQTPGLLGGAAGAAMTMAAMNKVLSRGGSGGKGGSGSGSSSKGGGDNSQQRLRTNPSFDKKDAMLGDGSDYLNSNSDQNTNVDSEHNNDNQHNNVNNNTGESDSYQDNNEQNDPYQDFYDDLANQEQEGLEDPSLSDPNYMHPEEYDDDGNYIGPRVENNDSDVDIGENQEEIKQQNIEQFDNNINDKSVDVNDSNINDVNSFDDFNDSNKVDEKTDEYRVVDESPAEPEKPKKPTLRQKLDNKLSPEARYYARGLRDKLENRINNVNPLRTFGGIAGGLAAGGIGLAAGIASGDLGNVAKYGGGALLGGYKLGSGKMSGLAQTFEVEGMEEIRERAKYETEKKYIEAKQKEYADEFRKNKNNQYKLEKKYGKEKAKKIMDKVVPDCIKYGINNLEDVITINEMMEKDIVKDAKMGASTVKYASKIGDTTKMKLKDKKEWKATVKEEFANNKKVQQAKMDTDKIADDVMSRVDSYYKIKDDIEKQF